MTQALSLILIGWAAAATVMLVLWAIYHKTGNATLVDLGWTANLAMIALIYALLGNGQGLHRGLMAVMALLWGARLSSHIFKRVLTGKEDERYTDIKKRWGGNITVKFFFMFQFQALTDVLLSIVFLFPALNPRPGLSALEIAGFILWGLALSGETLADHQLKTFKSDPASKGKTCRAGLWNYSRHPNYFFEWLNWCAYFLLALASPHGWIGIVSPALMLFFLFRVSGIPLTEAQSLKSKGDDYRRYQRTTSVFIPWFPKKEQHGPA